MRAGEGDNGAVLAAGLIIAVHGIGQEHLVQHRERTRIAGAHAEDHEILVLGPGIDDLDLLALDLKIHQVLGLREEEVLRAADGVEGMGHLHPFVPALVTRLAGSVVRGDIERFFAGNRRKQRAELFNGKLKHQFFPPL